jgi:hypothetical protein
MRLPPSLLLLLLLSLASPVRVRGWPRVEGVVVVRTSRTAARLRTVAAVAQATAQTVAQAVQPPAGQTMQRSRQNSRSAWTAQAIQY